MKNNQLSVVRMIMEEGFGKANLNIIEKYVSEHFIDHQFGAQNGKDGLKKIIDGLHRGLSNLEYVLQHSIMQDDTIWTHYKATAMQTGTFMGLAPSGKQISIDVIDIFRTENGLVIEHWGVPDRFAAMMQLGVFNKKEAVS